MVGGALLLTVKLIAYGFGLPSTPRGDRRRRSVPIEAAALGNEGIAASPPSAGQRLGVRGSAASLYRAVPASHVLRLLCRYNLQSKFAAPPSQ